MKHLTATSILLVIGVGMGVNASGAQTEMRGGFVSGSASGSCSSSYTPPDDYVPPSDPPSDPGSSPGTGTGTGGSSSEQPSYSSSSISCEDYDGWSMDGRVYLDTLDLARGPIALVPFLQRVDHVGLGYTSLETDSGAEYDEMDIDSRFVFNNVVVEASYGQAKTEVLGTESDADLWRLGLGYYLGDNTQVRTAYELIEFENGADDNRIVVDITHVQNLSNGMTWSANASVGEVDEESVNDDGSDINLSLDWFFDYNISVGTELTVNKRDLLGDSFGYEVRGEYYVNDYVSLRMSYYDIDYDDIDLDTNAYMFEVLYRR